MLADVTRRLGSPADPKGVMTYRKPLGSDTFLQNRAGTWKELNEL